MTIYFLDTSALVKRYIAESGSAWIKSVTDPSTENVIVISELTLVEMHSVFARQQRAQYMTKDELLQLQTDFLLESDESYLTVLVNSAILVKARELVSKHPLRALDAIQLACSLDSSLDFDEPLIFVSADRDLLSAATGEGFVVDNPLLHV